MELCLQFTFKSSKLQTSSKGVGDVEVKALAGEGAPGGEECPEILYFISFFVNNVLQLSYCRPFIELNSILY